MSTQQQAMIADTVVAIRKALKRKPYESDSDSSIEHNTNRGYKLKKRSRYVRQGRIAPSTDPAAYREVAEHAGYQRAILNRNPPLIDDEGYELDSDDNEDRVQSAMASAMEDNPYSSIHLEQLLGPLTAVTDLPNHPSLSRPFTSKALTELVKQSCNLMHKENAALWNVKPLLTKLIGDNTWAPCGMMIEPNDHELFTDTGRFLRRPIASPAAGTASTLGINGKSPQNASAQNALGKSTPQDPTGRPNPGNHTQDKGKGKEKETINGEAPEKKTRDEKEGEEQNSEPRAKGEASPKTNGNPPEEGQGDDDSGDPDATIQDVEMADELDSEIQPGSPRKAPVELDGTDRGQPTGLGLLDDLFIHPLFLPPRSAHPDRDLGLPEQEAEEVRRLLQIYVQKQEEVCRGTSQLYDGLLKADRYRKTVWQWAKAEAHCGPNRDMSDGEDWYDKEEWGLTEDLKKGEDEVEEDTAQTQKKTRTRR
ncbi:RXT2-like protein [Cercophora scortea]|uniref:RXT2-like protein n=1 Tax=Cercophora scortea TaxID=314031 RepID=A0AAE0MIR0_9PEZI|nr:RXT2-like protein [Cercophora scortea]